MCTIRNWYVVGDKSDVRENTRCAVTPYYRHVAGNNRPAGRASDVLNKKAFFQPRTTGRTRFSNTFPDKPGGSTTCCTVFRGSSNNYSSAQHNGRPSDPMALLTGRRSSADGTVTTRGPRLPASGERVVTNGDTAIARGRDDASAETR